MVKVGVVFYICRMICLDIMSLTLPEKSIVIVINKFTMNSFRIWNRGTENYCLSLSGHGYGKSKGRFGRMATSEVACL